MSISFLLVAQQLSGAVGRDPWWMSTSPATPLAQAPDAIWPGGSRRGSPTSKVVELRRQIRWFHPAPAPELKQVIKAETAWV